MPTRSALCLVAAALVTLPPTVAQAQLELAAPRPPPPATTQARELQPRQLFFSLRLSLGAAVAVDPAVGSSLAFGASTGVRWIFRQDGIRIWILGADAGVDRTSGFADRDATLLSAGATPGYAWGTWGLAWAPRAIVAWTDAGETTWGVRNGLRLLLVGGVIDLELAHQYLAGDSPVHHQALITLGLDPGLIIHALSQHRGRW